MENNNIPSEYKPLSPWAYIGYNILFAIPFVGFILLLVFSFNNENINRRNYARSFLITMIISVAIVVLIVVILLIFGVSFGALESAALNSRSY